MCRNELSFTFTLPKLTVHLMKKKFRPSFTVKLLSSVFDLDSLKGGTNNRPNYVSGC